MNRRQTKKALKQALAKPITLEQAAFVIALEVKSRGELSAFIDNTKNWPYYSIHTGGYTSEIITHTTVSSSKEA